jgi:hypothetical protein
LSPLIRKSLPKAGGSTATQLSNMKKKVDRKQTVERLMFTFKGLGANGTAREIIRDFSFM